VTTTRPVRRPVYLGAALLVAAGTALTVAPPATADQTVRFTTVKVVANSTEFDGGPEGFSAGDGEIFVDDVQRRSRSIGSQAGICTLALVSEARLIGLCSTTVMLSDGSLTTQGAFEEDPAEGPAGEIRWAVTGGTGRYAGATGEAVGTVRPDTDAEVIDWSVQLDR
jgi:hypothetical protein